MVAEFEADLIRMRTREGMQVAKAKGRLRGKQPKLKPNQAKHLLELHDLGTYSQAEIAELFGVGRSTVYRTIERMRPRPPEPERHVLRRNRRPLTSRAERACIEYGEPAPRRGTHRPVSCGTLSGV